MKKLQLLFLLCFPMLAISGTAIAASPFIKATTVGPQGRDGAMMFVIGNDFYFGGGTGKDFWVYHSDSNTTRMLPDIPGVMTVRSFGTAFAIGNKGYVCLGEDEGTQSVLKKDLWQFDPAAKTWTQKADFIGDARDGAFAFVVGSVAYVGGGSNDVDLYDDFYAYNATTDQWTRKDILPTGYTIFPVTFTINNIGYITGGQSGNTETNALFKYDTTTDNWDQMADFPGTARQCAVGFALGNKAYVGLGQSSYTTTYSDFYSYDPYLDQWAKINTFSGGSRAWSCAASNGTKAYFAFGWDLDKTFYNDLWNFDPTQATGIDPIKSSLTGISIYPNPANDYLYLGNDNHINIKSLTISDINGKILETIYPDDSVDHLKIDISSLAKGIYFMNISSGQAVDYQKFVVY